MSQDNETHGKPGQKGLAAKGDNNNQACNEATTNDGIKKG